MARKCPPQKPAMGRSQNGDFMDFKKITVEEWISLILKAIDALPVDDRYLSTKKGRATAISELVQLQRGLKNLRKGCPFVIYDQWEEFDTLLARTTGYIEFFRSMNGPKKKRQGRKPLPSSLLELFVLGFEFSRGRGEDIEKILAAFSQPDSESRDSLNGVFITKFDQAIKNRSYLVGTLPAVPPQISDFSWITKQKDRCFNNLIKIYNGSKTAKFHKGNFLELEKGRSKKQKVALILQFLKRKYGIDGFIGPT